LLQVSVAVAPGATGVENDWTRFPCGGGVFVAPAFAIGQVTPCWLA
jgi:hypothetical protein